MWRADPEGVKILDVRTPEEWVFTGHAPMTVNIPFAFLAYAHRRRYLLAEQVASQSWARGLQGISDKWLRSGRPSPCNCRLKGT